MRRERLRFWRGKYNIWMMRKIIAFVDVGENRKMGKYQRQHDKIDRNSGRKKERWESQEDEIPTRANSIRPNF